ncbi:MAG: ABC transporter permease, partial [Nocardioides sp.]
MNSALTNVFLVAGREISTRVRQKSFLISTAIMMVVIVAAFVVWAALDGRSSTQRVGLVDGTPALAQTLIATGQQAGNPITIDTFPDAETADIEVRAGSLDAAILVSLDDAYTLLSDKSMDAPLDAVLRSGITKYQLSATLAERGVTELPAPRIGTEVLTPPDPELGQRITIALVGAVLLMMAVLTGGIMVAVGVVEEKTSRIVELLLSTVRPLQLLWGKVLGIGLIALAQVVVLGVTALIAGTATGLLTIAGTATTVFAAVIAWFVLGFLFFAALYAAAGAMVSRQEELNGASTPLTMLAMATLYSGTFGIQALDSSWVEILSWIPPFSAVLMPIRIAVGDVGPGTVAASFALMIVACVAAMWISSRIYSRSVLRTGSRTSWSEVAS